MLKFTHGVMGAAKSAHALIQKYNYSDNGYKVLLIKSSLDTRDPKCVKSRAGNLSCECDVFDENADLCVLFYKWVRNIKLPKNKIIVMVDEAQFCTKEQINQLRLIANDYNVFCYGLKMDFKLNLFEGSKRLLELSDEVEEIKHMCKHCGQKANINAIYVDDKLVTNGETIITNYDNYKALCYKCYTKELKKFLDLM